MSHPLHQLPERGSTLGGKHASGMPQIVEVDNWDARVRENASPKASEVLPTQMATLRNGEHPTFAAQLGVPQEVLTELWQQHGWHSSATPARSRLGSLGDPPTVGQLGLRLMNMHSTECSVHVAAPQCGQRTEPKAQP